jgi:hypothetical protein
MVVPGRVKRYRITEIGFNAKENFIVRSSLVDARKVIKGIAKVVHGITPVTDYIFLFDICFYIFLFDIS